MTAYSENAKNGIYTVGISEVIGKLLIDHPEYDEIVTLDTEEGVVSIVAKQLQAQTLLNNTDSPLVVAKQGEETITVVPTTMTGTGGIAYVELNGKNYEIFISGDNVILEETTEEPGETPSTNGVTVEKDENLTNANITVTTGNNLNITIGAGSTAVTGEMTITYGGKSTIVKVQVKETYTVRLYASQTATTATSITVVEGEKASEATGYELPTPPEDEQFDKWLLKTAIQGQAAGTDATELLNSVTQNLNIYATYKELVGYFKTIDGVARYYSSDSDTTGTPITSENMGDYLGKKVKYIPGNAETNTNYGISRDYRLFYVDIGAEINGKYRDGQGTIYLKADCDGNTARLNSYLGQYSTDNRATMLKLNPGMSNNIINDTHDYCVAWMTDPGRWGAWKDQTIKLENDSTTSGINYVVGGVSLEMFVDSYNAYLDTHTENNVVQIYKNGSTTNRAEKLDCQYVTTGYDSKGYIIGFKNTAKVNWAHTGYYQDSNSLFAYDSANGQQMYNPVSNRYYWLASPSARASNYTMLFHDSSLGAASTSEYGSFCPLVSIKSGVKIEEKK